MGEDIEAKRPPAVLLDELAMDELARLEDEGLTNADDIDGDDDDDDDDDGPSTPVIKGEKKKKLKKAKKNNEHGEDE